MTEPIPRSHRASEKTQNYSEEKDPLKVCPVGTILDGKYEILSLVGRGAMGAVFKARTLDHQRELAIKVAYGGQGDVAKRFEREILVTSLVQHPNVIRVFDSGELVARGRYLAMDFARGFDLKEVLEKQGPLYLNVALAAVGQVLEGLKACHDKGVVHRDLKPENIRLCGIHPKQYIVLTDFGLSRLLAEDGPGKSKAFMTRANVVSGTPAYMSPESITEPKRVDKRCDLYSVGVTLFELLTGTLPFEGRSVMEYLDHHLYSAVPPLNERLSTGSIPKSVEGFVRRLMEKDRNLRFQTCDEALAALKDLESNLDSRRTRRPNLWGTVKSWFS